jgi:hypothetical protein
MRAANNRCSGRRFVPLLKRSVGRCTGFSTYPVRPHIGSTFASPVVAKLSRAISPVM